MRICFSVFVWCLVAFVAAPQLHAQQLRQLPGPAAPTGRPVPPVTQFTPLQIDLRYTDGSRFRVVPENEPLQAELLLLSDGAGLFSGTWEISEPRQGGFRILSRVRIPSAGRQVRRVLAPRLPVSRPGLYEVRFRGVSGLSAPVIRYSVQPGQETRFTTEVLLSPQPGQRIQADTMFRWVRVEDAETYRLEILAGPRRLTAVDTPRAATALAPRTLARLREYRGRLHWRVTAFDAAGQVVSISGRRALGERSAR